MQQRHPWCYSVPKNAFVTIWNPRKTQKHTWWEDTVLPRDIKKIEVTSWHSGARLYASFGKVRPLHWWSAFRLSQWQSALDYLIMLMIESSAPLSPRSSSGAGAAYAESRGCHRCHVGPDHILVGPDESLGSQPTLQVHSRARDTLLITLKKGIVRRRQSNWRDKQSRQSSAFTYLPLYYLQPRCRPTLFRHP